MFRECKPTHVSTYTYVTYATMLLMLLTYTFMFIIGN